MITIDTDAAEHFFDFCKDEQSKNSVLRIWVSGGGCSGLTYGMAIGDSSDTNAEEDLTFISNEVTIVCDNLSIKYLDGSNIAWSDDLIGGGFKVENPLATSSCGCGSSFNAGEESGCGDCSSKN